MVIYFGYMCWRVYDLYVFTDGLKVHEKKPESTTHFFVLTDISGRRSYTTCLTLYRPFSVEKVRKFKSLTTTSNYIM
jgi:hypothetical protein